MRRETSSGKSISDPPVRDDGHVVRTTIVIPTAVDRNLQVLSLQTGLTKNGVIKRALREFIEGNGLRPDENPKIKVSY